MTERAESIEPYTNGHSHKVEYAQQNEGAPLSRQVTVSMSPEQYERLFFQPSAPARGDAAKRFANPTLLGLIGFLIPYTSTVFILLQWGGAEPASLLGLSADYYFLGVLAMCLAGVAEFILGNTFPFAVFIIYGCHWGSLAYAQDPIHGLVQAFNVLGKDGETVMLPGNDTAAYNASQGFHNVTMCIVSFVLLIGTLRVNLLFTGTFLGLVFIFAMIAAADFATPHAKTPEDLAQILMYLKIGGGFGMLGSVCGWYLTLLTTCEAVGIPCPLPVFDLSSKVFPPKKKVEIHGDEKMV